MRVKKLFGGLRAAPVVLAVALFAPSTSAGQEKVLHNFGLGTDGVQPLASLILDAAGNLYGTTKFGGTHPCDGYGCGTVFELSPSEGGGWTEKKLRDFNGTDGAYPSSGLIFDAAGNLHGTTPWGGDYGVGTAFELTPTEGGGWTYTKLYDFGSYDADGAFPSGGLIFDATGNLYGATSAGGYGTLGCDWPSCGTVFELSPKEGGGWTEKTLHDFSASGGEGSQPQAPLILDAAGNLYGTAYANGAHGKGTVFELTPTEGGGWTYTKLHDFGGANDGTHPMPGLIFDAAGNLYGTTNSGGAYGIGTVFKLTPLGGGRWMNDIIHDFWGISNFGCGNDGANPNPGLVFDVVGNLYGTTNEGGIYGCGGFGCGTVFELSPREGGGWRETILYSFLDNESDPAFPNGDLVFDAAGNLYGMSSNGGIYGCWYGTCGTVFEITP